MPDKQSKLSQKVLTQEDKDKVVDWLKDRGREPIECAVCGHQKWTVGDHLVAPAVFSEGNIFLGGASYPVVMLICNTCGHTLYLNAVMMKLLPSIKELEERKKIAEEKKKAEGDG